MQPVEKFAVPSVRQGGRIPKKITILLTGCDAEGKQFIERSNTVVLSRHGAGIVSTHKLAIEQELTLVQVESNKEAEIRVVGHFGSADGSNTYGVAFLDPGIDFWDIDFSSATAVEAAPLRAAEFACTICGCREAIGPEALELDIYALHNRILRDCKHCKGSTLWTSAAVSNPNGCAALPEGAPVRSQSSLPVEGHLATARSKNRRKHTRIKVNFIACIHNPGSEDSFAQCENISRGGLCFKSSRRYYKNAQIEIAAPYSTGSPCILIPAQVVYVREIPEEKMFLCGVQYLDGRKHRVAA